MIDDEIREALKVEPSPEFLARVRTRIASEPSPSAWRWSWTLAGVAAIAAAIAIAVALLRPNAPAVPQSQSVSAAKPEPETAPRGSALPTEAGPDKSAAQRLETASHPVRTRPVGRDTAAAPTAAEPEILIDPRERRALLQLIALVRDGRIDLSAARRSGTLAPIELPPVTDIVIDPITIDPIAPQPGGEGARP
jgi:hypothetical protein